MGLALRLKEKTSSKWRERFCLKGIVMEDTQYPLWPLHTQVHTPNTRHMWVHQGTHTHSSINLEQKKRLPKEIRIGIVFQLSVVHFKGENLFREPEDYPVFHSASFRGTARQGWRYEE